MTTDKDAGCDGCQGWRYTGGPRRLLSTMMCTALYTYDEDVGVMGAGEIPPPRCHGKAALPQSRNANRQEFVLCRKYFQAEPARVQECQDAGKNIPSQMIYYQSVSPKFLLINKLDTSYSDH